jgi:hypothetical protein
MFRLRPLHFLPGDCDLYFFRGLVAYRKGHRSLCLVYRWGYLDVQHPFHHDHGLALSLGKLFPPHTGMPHISWMSRMSSLVRDQFWCWIGKYYIIQRLFGEYFWMWSALLLSFLLYIPLFFWSRGYLSPDNHVWWKFRIHARSLWVRAADPEVERRRSMAMIA